MVLFIRVNIIVNKKFWVKICVLLKINGYYFEFSFVLLYVVYIDGVKFLKRRFS